MHTTFDDTLRGQVAGRLSAFAHRTEESEGLRRAAVSVVLVADEDGQAGVVLCRRGRVGSHRGQWGLPGGGIDQGESAEDAAVRETSEETHVQGEVLGRLDDYVSRSGFHISPFVLWCPDAVPTIGSPQEIHSVHVVPIADLVTPGSPRWISIPESDRSVIQLPLMGTLVHAPTAAYLYQFAEVVLRDRHTRVTDVEEPVFAWR